MADLTTSIGIPDGVKVSAQQGVVKCTGPKGEIVKAFKPKDLKIIVEGQKITVSSPDRSMANTVEAHLKNMFRGAKDGYVHKLKAIYSHFPLTLEVKGKEILIKNFIGEKQPRKAKVVGSTKVEPKGQEVTVSGPSKEDVGQTIANLKTATKIRKRDSRVFQDGLYLVE